VLRWDEAWHAEAVTSALDQIARATSSNATTPAGRWLSDRQLIVAAPNILDEGMPRDDHPGVVGRCCICAEGVADEYPSRGWSHTEDRENGSKPPMVDAIRGVQATKWRMPRTLIARCNSASSSALVVPLALLWGAETRIRVVSRRFRTIRRWSSCSG
jgi:hypothetical protein